MKFDIVNFHAMQLNIFEFHESRNNKSHRFLKDVNENVSIFSTFFHPIWVKVCTRDIHRNVLSENNFVKIGSEAAILY